MTGVTDTLTQGSALLPGQSLHSKDQRWTLTYQINGHLCAYGIDPTPFWCIGAVGYVPGRLQLQSDGNLVQYDATNKVHWSTGTNGKGARPVRLVMQNDRNVVLLDANNVRLWSSGTSLTPQGAITAGFTYPQGRSGVWAGEKPGEYPCGASQYASQNICAFTNADAAESYCNSDAACLGYVTDNLATFQVTKNPVQSPKNGTFFQRQAPPDPDASYLGGFVDSSVRALPTVLNDGASTYTYAACKKAAKEHWSSLFALQSYDATAKAGACWIGPASGQTTAQAQGPSTATMTGPDGRAYGGINTNALYKLASDPGVPMSYDTTVTYQGTTTSLQPLSGPTLTTPVSFATCKAAARKHFAPYFGLKAAKAANGSQPAQPAQCAIATIKPTMTNDTVVQGSDLQPYGESSWALYEFNVQPIAQSNDADTNYRGTFAENPAQPALQLQSGTFTYGSCKQATMSAYLPAFALQNQNQCALGTVVQAKAYGPSTAVVAGPDGRPVGLGNANAVYEFQTPPVRPVNCGGQWSDWGACSTSCGGGIQARTYTVTTAPVGTGAACPVPLREERACNTQTCNLNCEGAWANWTACSAPCNGGTQTRTYNVTRASQGSGALCPTTQTQPCNTQKCLANLNIGQSMQCNDGTGKVYRYMGDGTMQYYPTPNVANVWDPNWASQVTQDCTAVTQGATLQLSSTYTGTPAKASLHGSIGVAQWTAPADGLILALQFTASGNLSRTSLSRFYIGDQDSDQVGVDGLYSTRQYNNKNAPTIYPYAVNRGQVVTMRYTTLNPYHHQNGFEALIDTTGALAVDIAFLPTTKTQAVGGNNGSVSCKTYCGGTGGAAWNGELPAVWNGATATAATARMSGSCVCVPTGVGWH